MTLLGLFTLPHRGRESVGIPTYYGCRILSHRAMGLASEVFKEETLARPPGKVKF